MSERDRVVRSLTYICTGLAHPYVLMNDFDDLIKKKCEVNSVSTFDRNLWQKFNDNFYVKSGSCFWLIIKSL